MMRAMLAWYQYTGDSRWKERIDRMVEAFDRILVVHKDDYAYVPVPPGDTTVADMCDYLRGCYSKKPGMEGLR